ncbi:MAG: ABC transporter ATP-binding protein [Planctomycetales bacterium]|nr:ABC transporter ATP-binding protein [Planctomycetales bacterium]
MAPTYRHKWNNFPKNCEPEDCCHSSQFALPFKSTFLLLTSNDNGMTSGPLIRLESVSKHVKGKAILEHLSFDVSAEGILVLLGPNGAGKTTLLRLIAGLEPVSSGTILFCGHARDRAPHLRNLAYVSQDYALYPGLTVEQNLTTSLVQLGIPRSETRSRVQDALLKFDLTSLAERLPAELSGGQAQRTALAKAVIRRPKLLLLDEPLSQLDGPLKLELRKLILQIQREFGLAMIVVTHDATEALRLGNQMAILFEGKLIQHGTPTDLYARPANRMATEILSPLGVTWLQASQFREPCTEQSTMLLNTSCSTRWIGVRPESFEVRPTAGPITSLPGLAIRGRITSQQFIGFGQLSTLQNFERGLNLLMLVSERVLPENADQWWFAPIEKLIFVNE